MLALVEYYIECEVNLHTSIDLVELSK